MAELDRLKFLVGRWKGSYADQFGEKGVLESRSECALVLGGRFLRIEGETRKDGAILNQSVVYIGYDSAKGKYFFKRMWSYGFTENAEGGWEDDNTLMFEFVEVDNKPPWFEGMKWRSFIRRYGEDEIGHGLYSSTKGEPFKLYGEARVRRERT
jgi:hypothetical protein